MNTDNSERNIKRSVRDASKRALTKKPEEKWFDLFNTTLGVVLGFALGLFASYYAQRLEHRRREEATARLLVYSIRADLGRALGTRVDILNRILPDKSFRVYPSGFNILHDVELLNSLKPTIGELTPEVVEAFVKYEFQTRQCALFRTMVEQSLQKEMDAGGTNRSSSESTLKAYAEAIAWLGDSGTNLLQKIETKYPDAIKR